MPNHLVQPWLNSPLNYGPLSDSMNLAALMHVLTGHESVTPVFAIASHLAWHQIHILCQSVSKYCTSIMSIVIFRQFSDIVCCWSTAPAGHYSDRLQLTSWLAREVLVHLTARTVGNTCCTVSMQVVSEEALLYGLDSSFDAQVTSYMERHSDAWRSCKQRCCHWVQRSGLSATRDH